jgi:phosphatidylglycerophosphatase A
LVLPQLVVVRLGLGITEAVGMEATVVGVVRMGYTVPLRLALVKLPLETNLLQFTQVLTAESHLLTQTIFLVLVGAEQMKKGARKITLQDPAAMVEMGFR